MNIYDPEFVRNLFNRMTASYERMNIITSFGFSVFWRNQFIKKLSKSDNKLEILDLLSGMGENWTVIYKRYPNSRLTALDFSDKMMEKSAKKNSKKFNNRVLLMKENLLENNLESNKYDLVTCTFGLKTFNHAQIEILTRELHRILKKNGEFSFIEVSKPPNKLLSVFYGFYLSKVIPVLGKMFLGNPDDYRMLWKYTRNFGSTESVLPFFEKAGLTVKFENYFFGCATGLTGFKERK